MTSLSDPRQASGWGGGGGGPLQGPHAMLGQRLSYSSPSPATGRSGSAYGENTTDYGDDRWAEESEEDEEEDEELSSSPSSVAAPPIPTAPLYRQLRQAFDAKPVLRDRAPLPLFSFGTTELVTGAPVEQQQRQRGASNSLASAATLISVPADDEDSDDDDVAEEERARVPRAVFPLVDFTAPTSGATLVEPLAALLAECVHLDEDAEHEAASRRTPSNARASAATAASSSRRKGGAAAAEEGACGDVDLVVSLGVRGCGALAHAVARELGVGCVLANWFPDWAAGERRVLRGRGVGGRGWVCLNGVPKKSRVAIVLDVVRSGLTAARLAAACLAVEGCRVVGVYALAAAVEWQRPAPRAGGGAATSMAAAMGRGDGAADWALSGYYDLLHAAQGSGGGGAAGRKSVSMPGAPPPLRALLLVSHSGEQTYVLSRREREDEWRRAQEKLTAHSGGQTAAAAAAIASGVLFLGRHRRAMCAYQQFTTAFPRTRPAPGPPRLAPSSAVSLLKRMSPAEVQQKLRNVTQGFVGVPVLHSERSGSRPYPLFTLVDYTQPVEAGVVDDVADLAVHFADLRRCDVLVTEGDRAGAALADALSLRTGLPYTVVSWAAAPAGQPLTLAIGAAGLRSGTRCGIIDDVLCSGGAAGALLAALQQRGATVTEAVFISEKLYPHRGDPKRLPARRGRAEIAACSPATSVTCLVQFVAQGAETTQPPCRVGE